MTSPALRLPTTYNNESSITCLVSASEVRVGVSTVEVLFGAWTPMVLFQCSDTSLSQGLGSLNCFHPQDNVTSGGGGVTSYSILAPSNVSEKQLLWY